MPKSLLSFFSVVVILQLTACSPSTSPNSPGALPSSTTATPAPSPLPDALVFSKALSRRSLEASAVPQNNSAPSAVPMPAPTPAPAAAPTAVPRVAPGAYNGGYGDISASSPYGYNYGYYSSGEFNQYVPLRAEELTYPGNGSRNLQTVYAETVQPMLQEWDSGARLLEARGNTQLDQPELIYLPGATGSATDSPREFKAYWIFRLASSPRQETLSIYVNDQETLAYRTVYGEPALAIQKASITSERALEIARAAFKNPDSPIKEETISDANAYPIPYASLDPNARVIYDLPTDLNWRTQVYQQGQRLVYNLSFDWQTTRKALGVPEVEVRPLPTPVPAPASTALPGETDLSPDLPTATPSPLVTPTPFAYCAGDAAEINRVYLSGSIAIDAQTGAVLSLNRPMYYGGNNTYYGCAYGSVSATPADAPTALPSAAGDI